MSKQEQAAQLLRLPDADYFSFDEARQVKLQEELASLASNGDVPGAPLPNPLIAIGSPRIVTADHSSVSILIGHVETGLRNWQVNFNSNLHLFVRNQSTGELLLSDPLNDMRRPRQPLLSGVGKPPSAQTASTVYAGVSPVNLRERFGEALKPGQLVLTAIVNELRSNSVTINLRGNTEPEPRTPASTQPYVRYKLEPQPTLPTRVRLPATASAKDGIAITVAVQLAVDTVQKGLEGNAISTFHIILVKLDENPQIITANVPVLEIGSSGGRHVLNAFFEVDVRAGARFPLSGNYQVYVDVGHELLGPYPLRVFD